ncbi:MAG: RNA polymerase-binding protein DksA, partial [Telluria sp.]
MKETVSKTAKKTSSAAAPATRKTALTAKAKPTTTAKAKPASRPAAKAAAPSRAAAPAPKAVAAKAARAASATKATPAKAGAVGAKAGVKTTPARTAGVKAASAKAAAGSTKSVALKAAPTKAAASAAKPVALKAAPANAAAKAPRSTKQKAEAVSPAAKAGSAAPASTGARMTGSPRGMAELADKIETPVVSKVSEVMTKTTKPNTAAQAQERILTDDEIRAMSDEDYMNPAQLAFFKAKLQALEKELLKNAGETTEHLRETVLVPDPADRATIEEEHALELRTRDRERKLLKKVQQSLASIESGEYGWCEETGEPIGIPRLIARP